jgi:acetolactate synthase-1/2/3 large subunit
MDGDRAIAKILKAEGVEWMTCFPHQSLIDAVAKEGIRPIICRQERAGVNMADGYSRINNGKKIGVFSMQRGPGAENAFSGVAQAFADSVPILLLPGGAERSRIGVHPGFDSVDHYRGITKWSGHINLAERIPEMMRRAYSLMKHGRPGPVLLEIPADVAEGDYPGGAVDYTPVKERRSAADTDEVRELVAAMLNASTPVINAGQGIMYAEATDELVEFAELTNIPVLTTLAGKSAFPENHRLALGTGAHTATLMVDHFLKKTDFVLGIGTSFTLSTFNAPMPPGVTLAHSTNCFDDLNKDQQTQFGAIGDAKLVLRQMIDEVKKQVGQHGRGDEAGVADEIRRVKDAFMAEWGPRLRSDEVPISPYRVFSELAKAVDSAETIITHDSGYPRDQLVPFWETVTPRGYLGWGKSTQLGYGLGLALGAKLAAPEKTVINVMGDAAFGMSGLDIETAARSGIGTLTVILNNSIMTHYSSNMPYATEHHGSNKLSGDYAKVADGLGAHAQRVDSPDRIAPAIRSALEATRTGQPAVIEMITKEEEAVARFW